MRQRTRRLYANLYGFLSQMSKWNQSVSVLMEEAQKQSDRDGWTDERRQTERERVDSRLIGAMCGHLS